ncbi:MAG TPA: ribosomal protein S18-alanine N-acetyltransferase, partial [Phototrophicaceae bacterium]|nr:ribosomal protein S18-alanine N-acetyltransferase [Phototrophicaceae bacterium]
ILAIEQVTFTEEAFSRETFDELNAERNRIFVVIEEDNKLLGYAITVIHRGEGYLASIAIVPAKHRSGYGRALIDFIKQQLITMHVKTFALHVRTTNSPAIALYERVGFKKDALIYNYYGEGEDESAYEMRLVL